MQLKQVTVPTHIIFSDGRLSDNAYDHSRPEASREAGYEVCVNTPFGATLRVLDVISGNGPTNWMVQDVATERIYPLMTPAMRDYLAMGGSIVKGEMNGHWQVQTTDKGRGYATLSCLRVPEVQP